MNSPVLTIFSDKVRIVKFILRGMSIFVLETGNDLTLLDIVHVVFHFNWEGRYSNFLARNFNQQLNFQLRKLE